MKQHGKVAFTPEFVESLEEGQVFVFGSNLIGCKTTKGNMKWAESKRKQLKTEK